jgi:hypothetical protein
MSEDNGRISVSRDALRAELAELELSLVEKLATKDEVTEIRREVDSLKTWRAYTTGFTACGVAIGSVALGVAVHLF